MSECGFLSGPSASGLIENQLSTITSKGDSAFAVAMSAMQQMASIFNDNITSVGAWQPGTPGSGNTEAIRFIKPLPQPTAPTAFTVADAPAVDPHSIQDLEGLLPDILSKLLLLIGEMPDPPTVVIDDLFLAYLSSHYTQLSSQLAGVLSGAPVVALALTRLTEWLQPGAVGMPAAVEQALRDRGLADIDAALARSEQEASDERAALGFSMPDGVLDFKLARARSDAADQRAKLNRDVLIQAADWERDTRKFGIEKGLAYDATTRETFFKLYEEARTIAATWQDNHIKVRMAVVEIYKAQVEGVEKAVTALAAMGTTVDEAIKAKLDAARMVLEQYDAQLKKEIARSDFDIKLYTGQIELYKQDISAESARVETLSKNDERLLSREKINADIDIESKRLELQKLIETARVAVSALDGIARTASQISGSVYSALNMGASISASSGYSNSSSCSTNYNISE